jgi:hypothetical protein
MSIILLMTRVYKKINGFSLSKQILANEGQGIIKNLIKCRLKSEKKRSAVKTSR